MTDLSYVNDRFGGDEEAAFNQTIMHIEAVNRHLLGQEFIYTDHKTGETVSYSNFGFDLRAVKFGHAAFDYLNNQPVIGATQLNATLVSRALDKEQTSYSLVAFLTAKEISDGFKGFKCGPVCDPPKNVVAISFHECPFLKENSKCLITTFHELLHAMGVEHSNDEDDDVMKEINASNMV